MDLLTSDFDYIRQHVKTVSGIVIEPGKEYLVESRISAAARETGYNSLPDFMLRLRGEPRNGPLHTHVVDALTINGTFFFRDSSPFESLKMSVLPKLIRENAFKRRISIWSAASSTGQEVYSLAIMLKEHFPMLETWTLDLLATDISQRVLDQAQEGKYTDFEVNRGLSPNLRDKYFTSVGENWMIKDEIRSMVQFKQLNLNAAWPYLGSFDIVLLRNVLIYFDLEQKRQILCKVKERLSPEGLLVLGCSETTYCIDDEWTPYSGYNSAFYKPKIHNLESSLP